MIGRRLLGLVGWLALLKVGIAATGAIAWFTGLSHRPDPVPWANIGLMLAYSISGLWLALGHRDFRASALGVCFALVASAFSNRVLGTMHAGPPLGGWLHLLAGAQGIAWLPAATRLFFTDFPRLEPGSEARPKSGPLLTVLLVVGGLLFAANLAVVIAPPTGVGAFVWHFASEVPNSWFWPVVLVPSGIELINAARRSRLAAPEERKRVESLVGGLVLGAFPAVVAVVLSELVPRLRLLIVEPSVFPWAQAIVLVPLASVPFTTAYAIQVHQALDVRIVARRAAQYAFARYTLVGLTTIPLLLIGAVLYTNRDIRVGELITGGPAPWLMLLAVSSAIALQSRHRALDAIDRRFFREQFETERIVSEVVKGCQRAKSVAQLDYVVSSELDRALHVARAAILALDPVRREYRAVNDRMPPLPQASPIAEVLGRGDPIDLTTRAPNVLGDWLAADRIWLAAAGAMFLVPLLDAAGDLIGILVLGAKRSELPFAESDRSLLTVVGATVSSAVERQLRDTASGGTTAGRPAYECPSCGAVEGPETTACRRCGGRTHEAGIPFVLSGKYQFVERIGAGGMGTVYRAVDRTLGRDVAIKTLPPIGALLAPRLRREARAMASVSHPNLATIYGLESWLERPMLVVEYLPLGTLADRLVHGPLPIREALTLGCQLADGLAHLHQAGVLHRDIKPSNVGFARDGRPKLLDFGLAKLNEIVKSTEAPGSPGHATALDSLESTTSGAILGTLPYMSIEATQGFKPEPSFDIWALSVTIFEAMTKVNPFFAGSLMETLGRISAAQTPDLRVYLAACPEGLARVFDQLLASDPRSRPPTGQALRDQLALALPMVRD